MIAKRTVLKKTACVIASAVLAASMVSASAVEALGQTLNAMGDLQEDGDIVTVWGADGLARLSESVAAGKTYEGKTVKLTKDVDFEDITAAWSPIGSKDHPFRGSFDGQGHSISNLTITGDSYLGFFGYVGNGGSVSNLTLENVQVTAVGSTEYLRCVGTVAGYCYGPIGEGSYALSNCKTVGSSSVTVTASMPLVSDEAHRARYAPESDVVPGVSNMGSTFGYIGGIAGYCAGSITGCSSKTAISATCHESCDDAYSNVGEAVGGIAGQCGGYVISEDIVEKDGERFKPFYPQADGTYANDGTPSAITHCANYATITTLSDGESGEDRFGNQTSPVIMSVGGIVGYSMASIDDCLNYIKYSYVSKQGDATGTSEAAQTVTWPTTGILAETGDGVGGIVGRLRAVSFTGSNSALSDAGSYKGVMGPKITVTNCINSSGIIARHAGAGIMGAGGTGTTVRLCANVNPHANIVGVRWNKPMTAGIAGQTTGNILSCYNASTVESFTHGGYYMAGIVGCTYIYETFEGDDFDSPAPQVAGCYFSGSVLGGAGYLPGAIVGQNEGLVKNCYASCSTDVVATDYGTVDESVKNKVSSSTLKSKETVANLNAVLGYTEFEAGEYFLVSGDTDSDSDNPYPILHSATLDDPSSVTYGKQGSGVSTLSNVTDLDFAKLSASGTGKASYSAVDNPLPELEVTYDGASLVERADFYPIPDKSAVDANGKCRDVSALKGTTLHADIVGMGEYQGSTSGSGWNAGYIMEKASFSSCSVVFKQKEYNFAAQWPADPINDADSETKVFDAAGNLVDADDYYISSKDEGKCIKYHKEQVAVADGTRTYIGYPIEVTANEDSNYMGTKTGYFAINKGTLFGDNCKFDGFSFGGKTWQWQPATQLGQQGSYLYSLDSAGNRVEGMRIAYTGESIKPAIVANGLSFKNASGGYTALSEGVDYKVVYGDPGQNSLASADSERPNTDVTSDTVRACITVRYASSANSCQFSNYFNFYFDIVQADVAKDCKVVVPNSMTYTGKAPQVKVYGSTGALIAGSNYSVSISEPKSGKATVTVKGRNNLKGAKQVVIAVKDPAVGKVSKISSVKVGKKKAAIKWVKVSGVTGYQIAYAVKGTKSWKTMNVKGAATVKATVKKLKKGKAYQFKVRAYKTVGSKKFYGAYCKVKVSAKIK